MLSSLPHELTSSIVERFDDLHSFFSLAVTSRQHFAATHEALARNSRLLSLFVTRLFSTLLPQNIKIILRRFASESYATPYTLQFSPPSPHWTPRLQLFMNKFPQVYKMKVVGEIGERDFCWLLEDTKLESLSFSRLTRISQNLFLEVFFPPTLQTLRLCNASITGEGLKLILEGCKRLTTLVLEKTDRISTEMFAGYQSETVTTLSLSGSLIRDDAFGVLLNSFSGCTALRLRTCRHITGTTLAAWPRLSALSSLSVSSSPLEEQNFKKLFVKCKNLIELHLEDCATLSPSFFSHARFPRTLLQCTVASCRIDVLGVSHIVRCCQRMQQFSWDTAVQDIEEVTVQLSRLKISD